MPDERPFITVQHPTNLRWAILEDDGVGAWMYITEPNEPAPIADCLVYSCIEPIDAIPANWDKKNPPPLTRAFASERAWQPNAISARIRVAWASSGRAAVALMDDEPVAFIEVGVPQGWSKSLAQSGMYGNPWDENRFDELFAEQVGNLFY